MHGNILRHLNEAGKLLPKNLTILSLAENEITELSQVCHQQWQQPGSFVAASFAMIVVLIMFTIHSFVSVWLRENMAKQNYKHVETERGI